ncbi:MAG: catechol 1,2-dioxygenase [Pseudonocardiales bacterium]|nr:catechol 1,2-dioxygenase [Pseudonocardiales bacterium]
MDDTRTAAIVEEIVAGLREIIRRHRVTYAEYRDARHFLTETVDQNEFSLLSDVLLEAVVDEGTHLGAEGTDSNVEGPFYVAGAPLLDADGGTLVLPMRPEEPGDRLLFTGAVCSTAGTALPSAVIDIWQADADGLYSRFAPDLPEWNLRGCIRCDSDGNFAVTTVVPAAYNIPRHPHTGRVLDLLGLKPHRPAHIHCKVRAPGHRELTTQVYFAGDPWLEQDVVGAAKPSLVTELHKASNTDDHAYRCRFDFVLAEN